MAESRPCFVGVADDGYHAAMTEVLTHAACLDHDPPFGFPERRERLTSILERLGPGGRLRETPDHAASERAIRCRDG